MIFPFARKLTLEGPVLTADGAGGFETTWEVLGQMWAELQPGTGRAVRGAQISLSRVPFKITVRAAPVGAPSRPLPGQRFVGEGRVFSILAVTEADAAGRLLICHAEEETVK